jgi:hypothetical protein
MKVRRVSQVVTIVATVRNTDEEVLEVDRAVKVIDVVTVTLCHVSDSFVGRYVTALVSTYAVPTRNAGMKVLPYSYNFSISNCECNIKVDYIPIFNRP